MSIQLNIEIVPLEEVPDEKDEKVEQADPPHVLVVDDERVIADTLSIILSRNGFSVMTAYDGQRALELARLVSPQLLISDVAMPGMNGVELATAIKRSNPQCKILLFSGHASTMDLLARARLAGHHFHLLSKPVHPSDMLRRVSECLGSPAAMPPAAASRLRRGIALDRSTVH